MDFDAGCGGSLYDPNPLIQEELWVCVCEERTSVSVDYLVARCGVSQQIASESLARFADACEGDVEVTYLVTGVDRTHGPISVMTQNVHSVAKSMDSPPRVQVFGVGPRHVPSHGDYQMMITDEDESTDTAAAPVRRGRKRGLSTMEHGFSASHLPPHVAQPSLPLDAASMERAKRRCVRSMNFPVHSPPLQQPQHCLPTQVWGSICGGR